MILYLLKYYLDTKLFSAMPEGWVRKMQLRRFRKTFERAKEKSAFYRKLYSDAGVLDLKIKTPEDIEKIPVIDKGVLNQHNIESILTCEKSEDLIVTNTSGSTGVPIDIYSTRKEFFAGYLRTFLATKHYNPFKPFGFIGLYKKKEEIEKQTVLYFVQNYFGLFRRESFSVFTPPEELITQLRTKKIRVLSSTPSGLRVLVDKLKEADDNLNIKIVVVSGETLFDDLRTDIKKYLNAQIINVYGCMEHPTLSWTEPDGDIFNFPSNSVFVEYINPIIIDGEWYGELVITNMANKTMPFIRYKIGDQVKMVDSCKRMGKILGRTDDILELENGEKVYMIQLYPFDAIFDYSQYKVIQKKNKRICFQAVCNPGVDKQKLTDKIISVWEEHFGTQQIDVEFVEELPINPKTGKFKLLERA